MEENTQEDLTKPEDQEIDQEVDNLDAGEVDGEQQEDIEPIDDGTEEIEFNSQNYKLPKDIAEAVRGMQKDYTTKTQSLADQRREFEAQTQFQQENFKQVAQMAALDDQLAEFGKVDFSALVDADPQLAQKLSFQRDMIRTKRDEIHATLAQKYQKETLERQLTQAKLNEQSETEIKRLIKDWSPELDSKMQKFAAERYGFPRDQVGEYKKDPKIAKLLHDAYLGQQIIQKQMTKPKVVPDAKPASTLSAKGGNVTKSPAQMTAEQYRKWRKSGNKQSSNAVKR